MVMERDNPRRRFVQTLWDKHIRRNTNVRGGVEMDLLTNVAASIHFLDFFCVRRAFRRRILKHLQELLPHLASPLDGVARLLAQKRRWEFTFHCLALNKWK